MKQNILDLLNTPVVGANHPSTSHDAAAAAQHLALGRMDRLVEMLREHPDGLADFEGSTIMDLPPDTYRPLRGKLVKVGVVVNTGRTRETPSGRDAIVWALTCLQGGAR